jgi:hypothetical protein
MTILYAIVELLAYLAGVLVALGLTLLFFNRNRKGLEE